MTALAALIAGELPDERGRFGTFGGRFVPETLVPAINRLEAGAREALADPEWRAALDSGVSFVIGRCSSLSLGTS